MPVTGTYPTPANVAMVAATILQPGGDQALAVTAALELIEESERQVAERIKADLPPELQPAPAPGPADGG